MLGHNFEIVEGSPDSPVILHVPHSATFIPPNVRADILLTDSQLKSELDSMTDTKTEEIARLAAAQSSTRPWLFINKYSRLVIDPERFPDDREVMNKVGMGAVYRKTSQVKIYVHLISVVRKSYSITIFIHMQRQLLILLRSV